MIIWLLRAFWSFKGKRIAVSLLHGEKIVKLYRVRDGYITITDFQQSLSIKTTRFAKPTSEQMSNALDTMFRIATDKGYVQP